jgi:hypothetical protein
VKRQAQIQTRQAFQLQAGWRQRLGEDLVEGVSAGIRRPLYNKLKVTLRCLTLTSHSPHAHGVRVELLVQVIQEANGLKE